MWEIVECPTCSAPAEVRPWSELPSTSGIVAHVTVLCMRKHRYLLPRDLLPAAQPDRACERRRDAA